MFLKIIAVLVGVLVAVMGAALVGVGVSIAPYVLAKFNYDVGMAFFGIFFSLLIIAIGLCLMAAGTLICKERKKVVASILK